LTMVLLKPVYLKRFTKDVARDKKRQRDFEKLKNLTNLLLAKQKLPEKHRNHKLQGEFNDCWECHIEPDWLLMYRKTSTEIIFVRLGAHADLFG